jgi:hypothetical protein
MAHNRRNIRVNEVNDNSNGKREGYEVLFDEKSKLPANAVIKKYRLRTNPNFNVHVRHGLSKDKITQLHTLYPGYNFLFIPTQVKKKKFLLNHDIQSEIMLNKACRGKSYKIEDFVGIGYCEFFETCPPDKMYHLHAIDKKTDYFEKTKSLTQPCKYVNIKNVKIEIEGGEWEEKKLKQEVKRLSSHKIKLHKVFYHRDLPSIADITAECLGTRDLTVDYITFDLGKKELKQKNTVVARCVTGLPNPDGEVLHTIIYDDGRTQFHIKAYPSYYKSNIFPVNVEMQKETLEKVEDESKPSLEVDLEKIPFAPVVDAPPAEEVDFEVVESRDVEAEPISAEVLEEEIEIEEKPLEHDSSDDPEIRVVDDGMVVRLHGEVLTIPEDIPDDDVVAESYNEKYLLILTKTDLGEISRYNFKLIKREDDYERVAYEEIDSSHVRLETLEDTPELRVFATKANKDITRLDDVVTLKRLVGKSSWRKVSFSWVDYLWLFFKNTNALTSSNMDVRSLVGMRMGNVGNKDPLVTEVLTEAILVQANSNINTNKDINTHTGQFTYANRMKALAVMKDKQIMLQQWLQWAPWIALSGVALMISIAIGLAVIGVSFNSWAIFISCVFFCVVMVVLVIPFILGGIALQPRNMAFWKNVWRAVFTLSVVTVTDAKATVEVATTVYFSISVSTGLILLFLVWTAFFIILYCRLKPKKDPYALFHDYVRRAIYGRIATFFTGAIPPFATLPEVESYYKYDTDLGDYITYFKEYYMKAKDCIRKARIGAVVVGPIFTHVYIGVAASTLQNKLVSAWTRVCKNVRFQDEDEVMKNWKVYTKMLDPLLDKFTQVSDPVDKCQKPWPLIDRFRFAGEKFLFKMRGIKDYVANMDSQKKRQYVNWCKTYKNKWPVCDIIKGKDYFRTKWDVVKGSLKGFFVYKCFIKREKETHISRYDTEEPRPRNISGVSEFAKVKFGGWMYHYGYLLKFLLSPLHWIWYCSGYQNHHYNIWFKEHQFRLRKNGVKDFVYMGCDFSKYDLTQGWSIILLENLWYIMLGICSMPFAELFLYSKLVTFLSLGAFMIVIRGLRQTGDPDTSSGNSRNTAICIGSFFIRNFGYLATSMLVAMAVLGDDNFSMFPFAFIEKLGGIEKFQQALVDHAASCGFILKIDISKVFTEVEFLSSRFYPVRGGVAIGKKPGRVLSKIGAQLYKGTQKIDRDRAQYGTMISYLPIANHVPFLRVYVQEIKLYYEKVFGFTHKDAIFTWDPYKLTGKEIYEANTETWAAFTGLYQLSLADENKFRRDFRSLLSKYGLFFGWGCSYVERMYEIDATLSKSVA